MRVLAIEPGPAQTLPLTERDRERFMHKIAVDEATGCWLWTGGIFQQTGYGLFTRPYSDGKWRPTTAQRASYELVKGAIPEGLELDHLCRVRHCVNPDHLEAVTHWENNRRGMSPSAIAYRTNRCLKGHEFTPENTFARTRNGRTKRECRECIRRRERGRNATPERRAYARAFYLRQKQQAHEGGDAS